MKIIDQSIIYDDKKGLQNRRKTLHSIKLSHCSVSADYCKFGADYFDNPKVDQGYKGYHYDGRFKDAALSIIDKYKVNYVLDFGCAKGFLLREFYKHGCQILGVENSKYVHANLLDKLKPYVYKDLKNIPHQKLEYVDFICMRDVLPHLEISLLRDLLSTIVKKCSSIKLFYVECIVADNKDEELDMKLWDPTHRNCNSPHWWTNILSAYDLPFLIYYKSLFR